MVNDYLPAVLFRPNGNSLSMERALKQIKSLLEQIPGENHKVDASLDDVDSMLRSIK